MKACAGTFGPTARAPTVGLAVTELIVVDATADAPTDGSPRRFHHALDRPHR